MELPSRSARLNDAGWVVALALIPAQVGHGASVKRRKRGMNIRRILEFHEIHVQSLFLVSGS
jgi:hypothetical protein